MIKKVKKEHVTEVKIKFWTNMYRAQTFEVNTLASGTFQAGSTRSLSGSKHG